MADTPTDRAEQSLHRIDVAHSRLKQAWNHQLDGHLQTGSTATGRISSSHIPDPASDTAANLERARIDVLAQVTEHTAALAGIDAIDADPSPVFRCRRLVDVLALHRQWSALLLTRIRALEADPARWDDAKSLTGALAAVAQDIHRTSLNAHRRLTQPDAPPGLRVCDDDRCQRPAFDNGLLCRTHQDRAERAAAMAEQRRRQVAADRANGRRCHGTLRPGGCEEMLSDRDRAANATNCGACRKWDHDERKRQAKRQAEYATNGAVAFRYHDQ